MLALNQPLPLPFSLSRSFGSLLLFCFPPLPLFFFLLSPLPPFSASEMSSLEAKIVVLGAQGVGKTSLLMRYCKGAFNPSQITSTVGASFLTKRVVDADTDTVVRLQIWDTGKSNQSQAKPDQARTMHSYYVHISFFVSPHHARFRRDSR